MAFSHFIHAMPMQPLPGDVIAQIKSSTTITSLNGVILELLKNSLDAGSTKVEISVDHGLGGCVVEDNGLGILPSEFGANGGLGKLYHSSKLNSQTSVHGGRGTFLTSLGAMSLLMITSHHHEHRSHNTLSMHKSNIISRQVPAPAQQYLSHSDHGTRVTVRDLFGSMPVRVMQRTVVSEKHGAGSKVWESLKSLVVLLCLAWPNSVTVSLREFGTNQRMTIRDPSKIGLKTDVSRVCSILSQSSFIAPEERASWVSVGASTTSLDVSGTISLDPSPKKHVQFISFDIQPIMALEGQSMLHDEINRLFLNSSFGNKEETNELDELERTRRANDARYKRDGYTNKELRGGKKGVDRWPMFYLNIQSRVSSTVSKCADVEEILDDKANTLSAVIQLLQVMIFEFLTRHHFRPKVARGQRSRTSQDVENGLSNAEHPPTQHDLRMATFASSPAANGASLKASKVKGKISIMTPNSTSDLLGTNVKLPSFRKPLTLDFPFDAWSRIKSGTTMPALHNKNAISTSSDIHRLSTASTSLLLSPTISLKPVAPSTPLISSTGKVTRRPFDDIPPGPSQSTSTTSTPLRTDAVSSSQSKPPMSQRTSVFIDLTDEVDDDDTVTWINPITKVTFVVNKRTGHAVPAADKKLFTSLHQSSCSPNVSPRQKIHATTSALPSRPSPWLSSLLERWENPIFRPTEPSIPQISLDGEHEHVLHGHRHHCTQLVIKRGFTEAASGIQGRVSKSALRHGEVIGQVDRKFILVKPSSSEQGIDEKMLVIIDQHAADERIRVESLLTELCTPHEARPDGMSNQSGIVTTYLENGIVFEVSEGDVELLGKKRGHFAQWGIFYDLPHGASRKGNRKQEVTVRSLPPGIIERCKSNPKILAELIRTELYSSNPSHPISTTSKTEDHSKAWLTRIHHCPQGIVDMINSRACRSAIMFNDVLSKAQCESLVRRLADTAFPFQCAHGRPSLLPLVEFGLLGQDAREGEQDGDRFGRDFRKWKLSLSS